MTCKYGHETVVVNCRGWKACTECLRLATIKHRSLYKERCDRQAAESRLRNKEKRNNYSKKYCKENPDKYKAYRHKRRAIKTQAGGYFTPEEWFTLCFAVGFKCLRCGKTRPLEADHVVPVIKGGTSWLHNIQPLCEECNLKKHTKCTDYRTQSRIAAKGLDSWKQITQ